MVATPSAPLVSHRYGFLRPFYDYARRLVKDGVSLAFTTAEMLVLSATTGTPEEKNGRPPSSARWPTENLRAKLSAVRRVTLCGGDAGPPDRPLPGEPV